jgi:hypothetical protein
MLPKFHSRCRRCPPLLGRSRTLPLRIRPLDQEPQHDRKLGSGARQHRAPLVEDEALTVQQERRYAVRNIRHAPDEGELSATQLGVRPNSSVKSNQPTKRTLQSNVFLRNRSVTK